MDPKHKSPQRAWEPSPSNVPIGEGQHLNPPPQRDSEIAATVPARGQMTAPIGTGQQATPQAGTGHQVVEHARRLAADVRRRAMATGEDKKSVLSDRVSTLVDKLDGVASSGDGSEPGIPDQLIDRGVGLLRRFQKALDENSTKDLISKAEAQIKARPGLFIAGFLALGFVGARLIRK
jgi:hypothetical protein